MSLNAFWIVLMCCVAAFIVLYMNRDVKWPLPKLHKKIEMPPRTISIEEKFLFETYDKVSDRFNKVGFCGLNESEKIFWSIWELEGNVNNDGFEGFFDYPSGDYAVETVYALEKIGAVKTANIVRRANNIFKEGRPPRDHNLRQDQLFAMSDSSKEELNSLDNEFYKYEENLSQLVYNFVKMHLADFPGN